MCFTKAILQTISQFTVICVSFVCLPKCLLFYFCLAMILWPVCPCFQLNMFIIRVYNYVVCCIVKFVDYMQLNSLIFKQFSCVNDSFWPVGIFLSLPPLIKSGLVQVIKGSCTKSSSADVQAIKASTHHQWRIFFGVFPDEHFENVI